jgi:hypothetical protein
MVPVSLKLSQCSVFASSGTSLVSDKWEDTDTKTLENGWKNELKETKFMML